MPDRRQLAFLEQLAADKADAQAIQLAKARQAFDAARRQLEMLRRYQGGYRAQIGERLEASIAIEALRGHQRFVANIEQAVRQQEVEVARRQANVDALERAWQANERSRQGFHVLGAKLEGDARRVAERAAQKQSDEFASRRHAHSHVGS